MAKLGAVKMAGRSGTQYKFSAYPLKTAFKKGLAAVFLVTRRRQGPPGEHFKHRPIDLDQTDDLRRLLADEVAALAARGANCICVHSEEDEAVRLRIQRDLKHKH